VARRQLIEISISRLEGDGSTSAIIVSNNSDNIGSTSDSLDDHATLLQVLGTNEPVVVFINDTVTAKDFFQPDPTARGDYKARFMEVAAPLQVEGVPVGAIEIKISLWELDRQLDQARTRLYLILLGEAFLTSLSLSILLNRTTLRPLEWMSQKMYQMAGGDYNERLASAARKDEIGQASQAFNHMSDQLQRLQAQIRVYLNPLAAEAAYRSASNPESNPADHTPAEIRNLTILFVDIVNFTGISENLGTKQTVAFLNYYLDLIASELLKVDGQINKFVADEVVCIFDGLRHADRALEGAQAIVRALRNASMDLPPARVRIGINTGECIVADVGSISARQLERTIIGDAVNIAQRLMISAQPNTIVFSQYTLKMLAQRPILLAPLGDLQLKGKAKRIPAYCLNLPES
jgi:class 3 adenylate cyclase